MDLDETTKPLFCVCLEDWSDIATKAGDGRRRWVDRFAARGLRAKLALDDAGTVGGMIQYLPIEQSTVGWCTVGNLTAERARPVAGEFGDQVAFREVDTLEHRTVAERGLADAVFLDGKQLMTGPPVTVERFRKAVGKKVARP